MEGEEKGKSKRKRRLTVGNWEVYGIQIIIIKLYIASIQ